MTMREPWLWPFREDSPWNLPVAATAEFEATTAPRTANLIDPTVTAWVNREAYSSPVTLAKETDPLCTVTDTDWPSRSATYRIPGDVAISPGTDASAAVVDPGQRYVHETWVTQRTGPASFTTRRHERGDLYGSGFGPLQGTTAAGASQLGGLIRAWEVQAGEIRHALCVALGNSQMYSGPHANDGWVWPATEQDGDAAGTYYGAVPMGSYFAIPAGVDVEALQVSEPTKVVARTLQRYGAYVVNRASCFILAAEPAADAAWVNTLRNELARIRPHFRLVTNNSPATPNGGAYRPDGSNRLAQMPAPLDSTEEDVMVGCKAVATSGTIANATTTAVSLASKEWDTIGYLPATPGTRLAVPAGYGGRYAVAGCAVFAPNGTGRRVARIQVNGGAIIARQDAVPVPAAGTTVGCAGEVTLNDGDYVELFVHQDSGAALPLATGYLQTSWNSSIVAYLSLRRIG